MQDLTHDTFDTSIKATTDAIVLFSKETCPLCQIVHPMLEEIEEEFAEQPISFFHVDAALEDALMDKFKLQGVPNTLMFHNGEFYQRHSGMLDFDEMSFLIERMMEGK